MMTMMVTMIRVMMMFAITKSDDDDDDDHGEGDDDDDDLIRSAPLQFPVSSTAINRSKH